MGIELAIGAGIAAAGAAASVGASELMKEDVEDPKDALELKTEADKAAERKRLARTSEKEAGGKTIFSDPLVAGGMPLKENLGV
jgi:hypothetical protein